MNDQFKGLACFGLKNTTGSALTKRTLMLKELTQLFEYVSNISATIEEYKKCIIEDNCLGKKTYNNRVYTFKYLTQLYSLNVEECLFRSLRYFYKRDPDSLPLLTLLSAFARDTIIRKSTEYIMNLSIGEKPEKQIFQEFINKKFPNRFGEKMLQSLIRNLLSSWTQSGHLSGRVNKVRTRVVPSAGSVSYALLLGYLSENRGELLFKTDFINILDYSFQRILELAEESSRRGWMVLKRVGNVIEVSFPNIISQKEMEKIYEQN